MKTKRIITIGIVILLAISSIITGYYLYSSFESEDQAYPEESYSIVSYNLTIDAKSGENYTMYVPVPLHPGKDEPVARIINNLTREGNVDYSIAKITTPLGKEYALKVEGENSGKIKFNRTLWHNTSKEREKYRPYQIVDLSLLYNNRRKCYIRFDKNSSIDAVDVTFNTYYSSVDDEDKWKCYWDAETTLGYGWNEVELDHYCDPDV